MSNHIQSLRLISSRASTNTVPHRFPCCPVHRKSISIFPPPSQICKTRNFPTSPLYFFRHLIHRFPHNLLLSPANLSTTFHQKVRKKRGETSFSLFLEPPKKK